MAHKKSNIIIYIINLTLTYTTQYIIFTVIIYVTLYFMGLQFIDNLNTETTREFPSKNQLEK